MTDAAKLEYARLFKEYRTLVATIIRRILHRIVDETEVDDLTQDVFERGWRHFERHGRDGFHPWISTIATNRACDRLRHESVRIRCEQDARPDGPDPLLFVRNQDDPLAELIARDAHDELVELTAGLPEVQRETVLLRYVCELGFERIAEIHGVPVSTSKTRLRYGLQRLRDLLGVEGKITRERRHYAGRKAA